MSGRAAKRAELLQILSEELQGDLRIAGAVLVGSGATGFRDDESDIDIVAPVAHGSDAAMVFLDWKERIHDLIDAQYLAETAATEQEHLLVLHCDGLLEIDISFPPLQKLTATAPRWQILWQRSDEIARRLSEPSTEKGIAPGQEYIWTLNRAVHRITYAARALRRGEVWKAMLQLDELRRFVLQLASLNLFGEQDAGSRADTFPPELLAAFSRSLPAAADAGAVQQSLRAWVDILLDHAAALDRRYGEHRAETVGELLMQHVQWPIPDNALHAPGAIT